MTEERYWAALFGILHDGGIDNIEELVGKIDDDYETGDEADAIINDDEQMTEQEHGEKKKQLGRTPIAKLGAFVFFRCTTIVCFIHCFMNIATSKPQNELIVYYFTAS